MRTQKLVIMLLVIGLLAGVSTAKEKKDSSKKSKKGRLSISANASFYDPPGPTSSALLFEVAARYRVSDKITAEASLGWSQYDDGGTTTMMPVQVNGEYHPLGQNAFDPYVGAGLGGYFTTRSSGDNTATVGGQALAGIEITPQSGFSINFEVKYMLQDFSDFDTGSLTYGGGVSGNWEMDL